MSFESDLRQVLSVVTRDRLGWVLDRKNHDLPTKKSPLIEKIIELLLGGDLSFGRDVIGKGVKAFTSEKLADACRKIGLETWGLREDRQRRLSKWFSDNNLSESASQPRHVSTHHEEGRDLDDHSEDDDEVVRVECPECAGSGKDEAVKCDPCDGTGYIYADIEVLSEADSWWNAEIVCPRCGDEDARRNVCPACEGLGYVWKLCRDLYDDFHFDPEIKKKKKPREYQKAAIGEALENLDPCQPIIVHLGTGGGKTLVANNIVEHKVKESGGWALWLSKDWALLFQAARDIVQRFDGYERSVARIGGDRKKLYRLQDSVPALVSYTTIQTFYSGNRSSEVLRKMGKPTLVVWDECHWGEHGDTGKHLLAWCKRHSVPVLGLTATPKPPDESAFKVIYSMPFATLVKLNHLAKPKDPVLPLTGEVWTPEISRNFDDFTQRSLRDLASKDKRNKFIVDHYIKHSQDYGKTIVFACDIQHVTDLTKCFWDRGVTARSIHSQQHSKLNDDFFEQFRGGKGGTVQVLVNVEQLTHGVDAPQAKTVFLCRPTTSDILFSQMIGRVARRHEESGKEFFNIVEFTDNLTQFGKHLFTSKNFFEGAGIRLERERATLPPSTPTKPRNKHAFDPVGAPTWIDTSINTPPAAQGLWYRHNQTFGVEFELTSDDFTESIPAREWEKTAESLRIRLAEKLSPALVARSVLSRHFEGDKDHSVWNIEWDASCGWEVTSRILSDYEGFVEIAAACDILSEAIAGLGLKVNYRTGTHIHLGWLGKTDEEVKRAIMLARLFEPALATLVSPSRLSRFEAGCYDLREPNEYCRTISTVFNSATLASVKIFKDIWNACYDHDDRYVTFNIMPLDDIHTVEVRMLNGTIDAHKVLLWLSLWKQILWSAAMDRPIPAVPDCNTIVPDGDVVALARRFLPEVQQPRFLERLEDRRMQILETWKTHPDLVGWVANAEKWEKWLPTTMTHMGSSHRRYCTQCGSPTNDPSQQFCGRCGTGLAG